jgi:hypothetical protein
MAGAFRQLFQPREVGARRVITGAFTANRETKQDPIDG